MSKLKFDLKLPKGYLSFSAMNEYLYDPAAYYRHYFLGENFMDELREKDPGRWEKIKLGAIFQDAWADPRKNWRRQLAINGFTPDKERIMRAAFADKCLLRFPPSKCELTFRAEHGGIPLLIKVDGWDEKKRMLLENKFGAVKSQEMVDEDNQLSFYDLVLLLLKKAPKSIILQSVNDRTGKVLQIHTKRRKDDRDHIKELILTAAEGISKGIWEK